MTNWFIATEGSLMPEIILKTGIKEKHVCDGDDIVA